MKQPRLQTVEALPEYQLKLTFIDGGIFTVSLADAFDKFPGLKPLQNIEEFNKAVVIDGEGWTVEWPELDIQIGADTLWLDAQTQNASNEATRLFAGWRERHGLSLAQAANALGLTPRTVSAYGSGARQVPRAVLLALKGWEAEQAEQRQN
ncbi:MAG: hypothetical protein RLZ92_1996 [Pseudomonadota bacterium]|jgi:DNA-binding XRE family transcriptional regulator